MSEIKTVSNKAEREIITPMPDCLMADTLQSVVELIGEEVAFNKIKAQLIIDFRAKIRALLESESDGEATYTDEAILDMDFSDWKPEARVRKSAAEKASDLLGKLNPEELAAALAKAGIEINAG